MGPNGALNLWNNAPNTGYYLQYTSNCSGADVNIGYKPHGQVVGNCAMVAPSFSGTQLTHATVSLSEWAAQANLDDVTALIAHEIGHVYGLGDTSTCGNTDTVMGPHYELGNDMCYKVSATVTVGDAAAAANVINRSSACTQSLRMGGDDDMGPTGGGGGGGCNSGCYDPFGNCLVACDFSSGDGVSPIIIDTGDVGFHLTSLNGGVRFRIRPGDSFRQMSWTDARWANGWLVLDRNGNGSIDDLTELFGNITPQQESSAPNGFLALAVFDDPKNGGNQNGFIDPDDAVYSHLRVWIDANQNGISEPSELHTLQEVGIFKIGLTYSESRFVDRYGNQFRFKGTVWNDKGSDRDACYDVFLSVRQN